MESSMIKRLGATTMVLLHLFWSVQAFAVALCSSSSGLGSVFSVLKDGTVVIKGDTGAGGTCNVIFLDTSSVNSATVTQPGQLGTTGECKTYSGASSTTGQLGASGSSVTGPTLSAFSESTSNNSVSLTSNGLSINGTSVVFANDGTVVSGTTIAVKKVGNQYVFPGGDYNEISWETLDSRATGFTFTGPIRAKWIHGGNCHAVENSATGIAYDYTGLTFAQDDATAADVSRQTNYINKLDLSDGCGIHVAGPGKTTLNISGVYATSTLASMPSWTNKTADGFKVSQSGTCINFNYADCVADMSNETMAQKWARMYAQRPDRLQINIYHGDYAASDHSMVAAGVYVPNGNAVITSASGMVFVGELLAKNITVEQNNNQVYFFSKSTVAATLQTGAYSLTPPVPDPVLLSNGSYGLKAGAYVYRTLQQDYLSDGKTPGTSGHLGKFLLKEDSTQEAVSDWDAADPILNTLTDRANNLYTNNETGLDFVLLQTAPTSIFTDGILTSSAVCIINPSCNNGANLNGRDPASLVGVPWRTYPIVVGKSVMFATDDGILYSVNKATGKLNWGWIPRQLVPLTAKPSDLASKHAWGQIASGNVTKLNSSGTWVTHTYVTGTAMGGQLHFSIEVSADGSRLSSSVWQDYRANQFSPGSETWGGYAGRPYGGASPLEGVGGTGKVAYVVNNQLVTRAINESGTTPAAKSIVWLTDDRNVSGSPDFGTVTSNLIYMGDSAIYFGGSNGRAWQMNSEGNLKTGAVNINLGLTEAITSLNGAKTVSAGGNGLTLLAQSASRVSALKSVSDTWSFGWYTSVGASSTSISSIAGTVPYIPSGSNAYISAPTDIIYADGKSQVVMYYTTKDSTGCDIKGYEFGPFALESGSGSATSTYIGKGEAVGGYLSLWESASGSIYSGVLAATGGTGSANTETTAGAAGAAGGTTSTLSTNAQTKFLGGGLSSTTTRLNWREMTNFF